MQLDTTFVAARIVGPVLSIAGVGMIAQNERMLAAIGDLSDIPGLMTVTAFVALIVGLALITLHRRWDTFSAILVSLIGWIAVLRASVALLAPDFARTEIVYIVAHPYIVPIAGCITALLGVWLSYAGYIAGIFRVEASPRIGL